MTKTSPTAPITNVSVFVSNPDNISIHWDCDNARFHQNLGDAYTVYKNPPLNADGSHKGAYETGYFTTRHLNVTSANTSRMLDAARTHIDSNNMINKAIAAYHQAERDAERLLNDTIAMNKAAHTLYAKLRDCLSAHDTSMLTADEIRKLPSGRYMLTADEIATLLFTKPDFLDDRFND